MSEKPRFESLTVSSHEEEIAQARDYYVVQHNDMVQKQRFSLDKKAAALTALEEKIFLYIISQIKPDAEKLEPITFDIQTFCAVTGIDGGKAHNYDYLKASITKLKSHVLWLKNEETGEETTVGYIARAKMNPRSGKVQIQLDEELTPYLIRLAGNYFQFSYHNILAMKSKYGIQLYRLLKSYYFNFQRVKFSLDDLKMHLDAAKYENFANFKKKVIEPALRDINSFSDLAVEVEYVKTGRSFTHVIFTMQNLEKPKNPAEAEEAQRRYMNVEREIDPDQLIIDGYDLGELL